MKFKLFLISVLFQFLLLSNTFSQSLQIDNFENFNDWQKVISDGVSMHLSIVDGYKGKCLKVDYEFNGSGYCGIQKNISLELPKDYKFNYYLKANSPNNNLEFKLTDSTGENVWWLNQHNFEFPNQWQKMVVRRRDIAFAWGPIGGGEMNKVYNLQIIISASQGGKGTIYLDELNLDEVIPPKNPNALPILTESSNENGSRRRIIKK